MVLRTPKLTFYPICHTLWGMKTLQQIDARIAELQRIPKDLREFEQTTELRSLIRKRHAIASTAHRLKPTVPHW